MAVNFDDLDSGLDDILPKTRGSNAPTESGAQAGFPSSSLPESVATPSVATPGAPDPSGMPPELPDTFYEQDIPAPYTKPVWVQDDQPWGEPVDFWQTSHRAPEMRHEWMPPALADLFMGEAETWAADPGIYGMFGIGICAGALSNAVKVQVKEGDPYALKAARLWLVVNANSGSGKTPILLAMARPLEDLQEELLEKHAWRQKQYKDDLDVFEKQRQAYISARAKGEPATRPEEPELPPLNRLIVKNATGEAIPTLLSRQGQRGLLGLYDEFTSLPAGANQYKKGGNDIEELLKLRDGGRHSVDRQGSFVQIAENAMNIVGGTQPKTIKSVLKRMNLTQNGFLQRFNVYNARKAGLDLDRPAHVDFARLTDIVQRIYEMQANAPVRLSEGAQEVRKQFRLWAFEQRQRPNVSDEFMSHLSKLPDMWAEFCLTYHAIESADERRLEIAPEISEDTAQRVYNLMTECLFPHAQAFYADIIDTESETIKYVRYLAGKILAKNWASIDLRKITRGWTKFRTLKPWEKRAIFTMLSEGGWIQSNDPRGYVEGMAFKARVHPDVGEIFAGYAEIEAARLEEMEERRAEKMRGQADDSDC